MSANGSTTQCEAITRAGARCQLRAGPGSTLCHVHALAAGASHHSSSPSSSVSPTPLAAANGSSPAANNGVDHGDAFDAVELREQMSQELRRLTEQVETQMPPIRRLQPLTPTQVMRTFLDLFTMIGGHLPRLLPESAREIVHSDWFDVETWRGIGYVLQVVIETQVDFLRRRVRGDYHVDAWGYDEELTNLLKPLVGFLYGQWWRVEMTGLEHIPAEGRTLLAANHSGVLPLDGAMIAYGVSENHPARRLVRALVANWFPSLPIFSILLARTGQVLAHPANGARLLNQDELVLVFPEGYKGVGKSFKDRYKLARFGRGGFARMAIQTGSPILPVSVVGAEEAYPMLINATPIARLLGWPYFPITLTFPWLGPLGFIPLPSKWYVDIGPPISTAGMDPTMTENPAYLSELTDQVRNTVQDMVDRRLSQRNSIFAG